MVDPDNPYRPPEDMVESEQREVRKTKPASVRPTKKIDRMESEPNTRAIAITIIISTIALPLIYYSSIDRMSLWILTPLAIIIWLVTASSRKR